MIQLAQAKALAQKEMPKLQISKSVKYRNYFVFFMQPDGINPASKNAMFDSYVFVNAKTGKIEYLQPWDFDDFPDRAVVIQS